MALVHQNFPAGILNTKGLGLEAGDGTSFQGSSSRQAKVSSDHNLEVN